MFIDIRKLDKPIENVDVEMDNLQQIRSFTLKNSQCSYKLIAVGDCCSFSIFKVKEQPFTFFEGKIIETIEEIDFPELYEFDDIKQNDDYYASPHLYQISFKDIEEKFEFMLINYSNGYYDGWIEAVELLDE
jgi:hypothetical protein